MTLPDPIRPAESTQSNSIALQQSQSQSQPPQQQQQQQQQQQHSCRDEVAKETTELDLNLTSSIGSEMNRLNNSVVEPTLPTAIQITNSTDISVPFAPPRKLSHDTPDLQTHPRDTRNRSGSELTPTSPKTATLCREKTAEALEQPQSNSGLRSVEEQTTTKPNALNIDELLPPEALSVGSDALFEFPPQNPISTPKLDTSQVHPPSTLEKEKEEQQIKMDLLIQHLKAEIDVRDQKANQVGFSFVVF